MCHSWRSYLLLLLIEATVQFCLITTVECYDDHGLNSGNNDLVLLPHNPEVEDGRWLTLNCTILPHYTGNYSNRDLYFRHGTFNFTNTTLVGSTTALLKLQWTLADDGIGGGHIKCALPDRQLVLSAIQHVIVVRPPLQPVITGCLLLNWKHVNCTWQPSSSQQADYMHSSSPLIQTLQWTLGDEVNDIWQDAVCKGEVIDSCMWNMSHIVDRFLTSDTCCVQLFARLHLNHLRFEQQSARFCFRPAHIVVIDKPRNVTAISTGAHQIFVQWQAPLLDPNHISGIAIVYTVTVMSQWSDLPVINQLVVNRSLSFISIPHTRYAVTVKVKTLESQIWSDPISHNFTTAPAIPKMSPASSPNAFTVSHVSRYTRTVIVYWETLSAQDFYARSLSYVVLMRKPPALWNKLSVIKSANISCTEVNVDTDADVELTVIARNEVGDTLPDVVMRLPAVQSPRMMASLFTELAVELANDSTVIWSWRLKSSERTGSLTLFWCRSRLTVGRCVGDIHWLDVSASESEYNMSMDADDINHYHYGAALKADDIHTETGGIEWVTCLYSVSGLAAPVQDIQAYVPSYGHPGQLLVTWVHPLCDNVYHHGYIKSFMLYYCRHVGTECVDEPSQVPLEGYRTAYNLTGLQPDEEYSIWMYSLTRAGRSRNHSDIVITITSAPILTPAVIAGLTVSGVIVLLLALVVVWMLAKYCRRCRDKLWSPVTITAPPASTQSNNTSMSAPIVEYSRISYMRQGSRLSSSSRDSGQFDVGSPFVLPESCSESVVHSLTVPDNHADQRRQPHTDVSRPAATMYVNDRVVILRRPTENNHHQPSSLTTGHVESYPLQPMKSHDPQEAVTGKVASTDAVDDDEDDTRVTDSLINSRMNGGCDTAVLRQNTDYIPHEWLKQM